MSNPRTAMAVALSLVLGCAPTWAADAPAGGKRAPAAHGAASAHKSAHKTASKPAAGKSSAATKAAPSKRSTTASAKAKAKAARARAAASRRGSATRPLAKGPTPRPVTAPSKAPAVATTPRAQQPVQAQVAEAPRIYLPPLGPERFYPNGIPELRPEFMHPLPDAQAAQRREQALQESVAEDRRAWFAAPQ